MESDGAERIPAGRNERPIAPGAAHDLRTPLTTILLGSRILRRAGKARHDAQLQEVASAVEADAERLRDVVEDVLVATRSPGEALALNTEPVLLERMVSHAVDYERVRQPGVRFNVQAEERDAAVLGDEGCLEHVLRDLVGTAARRAGPGSTLDVSVGSGQMTIIGRNDPAGNDVVPPSPDYSDQWRLEVCRDLVEAMGGTLWLGQRSSRPQIGLQLPIAVGD